MTTATVGRRLVKNKFIFYLRMLQLCKFLQYTYWSKNLLRLNMHRQRLIPKEDFKILPLRFAFSKIRSTLGSVYAYPTYLWIRNFFFPDTSSVHTHPANSTANPDIFMVAQNSSQHSPRLKFWWVIITTLYQLMLQSWYQKTAQSLVNTVLFSWQDKLP